MFLDSRELPAQFGPLSSCLHCAHSSRPSLPPTNVPGLNPRVTVLNISSALVLTFKSRPPQGKAAEILVDKLENAGFRPAERFPKHRSWTLKPHEWPGPSISRVCSELMRDDKIRSLLASCEPDILIRPVGRGYHPHVMLRRIDGRPHRTSTSLRSATRDGAWRVRAAGVAARDEPSRLRGLSGMARRSTSNPGCGSRECEARPPLVASSGHKNTVQRDRQHGVVAMGIYPSCHQGTARFYRQVRADLVDRQLRSERMGRQTCDVR